MFINLDEVRCKQRDPEEWRIIDGWRVKPFIEPEYQWSRSAIHFLSQLRKQKLGVISGAAVAQWLDNSKMAFEMNDLGVHALIGSACSCGLGAKIEPVEGKKQPTRAQREAIVMSLVGHFDVIRRVPTNLFVRGVLELPKRSYWIQPPGKLEGTRWHCIDCGDLEEAVPEPWLGAGWRGLDTDSHPVQDNFHGYDADLWQEQQQLELEYWTTKGIK